jgi:hypothetical protein
MQFAFVLAAYLRFRGIRDLREIARFVAEFNAVAPPEARIPPRDAEAMLRGALGEFHLSDAVDTKTAGTVMYTMLLALLDDIGLPDEEVDTLLLTAEKMVLDAEESGALPPVRGDIADAAVIGGDEMFWRMPSSPRKPSAEPSGGERS